MLNRSSTFIHFWRFFPTTWLIEPPRLFDIGHFFLPTHYLNSTLIRDFRVIAGMFNGAIVDLAEKPYIPQKFLLQ
jgi:hypothetical protein